MPFAISLELFRLCGFAVLVYVGQKKMLLIALYWSTIGSLFHAINRSCKLNSV